MKNVNFDKLDKLPESVLTDISDLPETQQPAGPTDSRDMSKDQLFETGTTAEIKAFPGLTDSPGITVGPAGDSPGMKPASTPNITAGSVVGGKFAVDLMDSLIPSMLVLATGYLGYELDRKNMVLTSKEKEAITPAMQQYLDSININFNNPLYNLLFVIAAVYGAKVVEQLPTIKKKQPKAKVEVKDVVSDTVEKIKQQKEREQKQRDEIAAYKKVNKLVALKMIADSRKLSKEKALNWYNKNVA